MDATRPPYLHKTATRHRFLVWRSNRCSKYVRELFPGLKWRQEKSTVNQGRGENENLAEARAAGRKLDGMRTRKRQIQRYACPAGHD